MTALVDSHCHLDFPDFAPDLDAIVERAAAVDIARLVSISTRVRRFDKLVAIVERFANVYSSIGTHPHYAHEEPDVTVEELVERSRHPKVVAIGEAGLDYHYDYSPRDAQETGFRRHIAAARATGLPLVVHAREADADIGRILEEESGKGAFSAVLHCFTASRELALRAIDLGFYVGFTGILTFKNSEALRAIAAELPADRILVETDAPYLAPGKFRGKRNEPSYVTETARALAATRGVPFDEIARQTTENFFRLFRKVPAPSRPPQAGADRSDATLAQARAVASGAASSSPSPHLRGEGRGEGASPRTQTRGAQTRGAAPSPGICATSAQIPTSPRKRGRAG
jgi:TatD DNase family protein